jgi:hypothetical protein
MCLAGIRTAPFSVIRLHGPNRAKIEEEAGGTWNKIVEPKNDRLRVTADVIRQNVESGVHTHVNPNNHYEESAPLSLRRLLEVWREG